MRLKNFILISSLLLAFFSCCKEEIIYEGNTLIGSWEVHQIDSCTWYSFATDIFNHKDTLPYTTSIIFSEDSTGMIADKIPSINGEYQNFHWSHNRQRNRIDFTFNDSISTYAFISTQKTDILNFYMIDFLGPGTMGSLYCYYFKMKRN